MESDVTSRIVCLMACFKGQDRTEIYVSQPVANHDRIRKDGRDHFPVFPHLNGKKTRLKFHQASK